MIEYFRHACIILGHFKCNFYGIVTQIQSCHCLLILTERCWLNLEVSIGMLVYIISNRLELQHRLLTPILLKTLRA